MQNTQHTTQIRTHILKPAHMEGKLTQTTLSLLSMVMLCLLAACGGGGSGGTSGLQVDWPTVQESIVYGTSTDAIDLDGGSAEKDDEAVPGTFSVVGSELLPAGQQDIRIRFQPDDTELHDSVETDVTITVEALILNVTGLAVEDKVYDGTDAAEISGDPALEGVLSGDVVSLAGEVQARFASTQVSDDQAIIIEGLLLSGEDSDNYALPEELALQASITPRSLQVSGLAVEDKQYDGTDSAVVSGDPVLADAIEGDDVRLSGALQARFASPDVGQDREIILDGLMLTGDDADNYSLAPAPDVVADITPRSLEVDADLAAVDRDYDASDEVELENAELSGVLEDDTVSLMARLDSPDAGMDRSLSLQLQGEEAGNYVLQDPPALTVTIAPKAVSITPHAGQMSNVGEEQPVLTFSHSGLLGDDEFTGSLSFAGTTHPGVYAITLGSLSAGDNYFLQLSDDSVTFALHAVLPQTGQEASYYADDDGDLQLGAEWPSPRFIDHEDGTVTDQLTGLMWQRAPGLSGTATWNDAIDYANDSDLAGYDDWRLPNRNEKMSLADAGAAGSALPEGHPFALVDQVLYWTSSTVAEDSSEAWAHLQNFSFAAYGKANSFGIWLVRGATTGPAPVLQTGQRESFRDGDDAYHAAGVRWPR